MRRQRGPREKSCNCSNLDPVQGEMSSDRSKCEQVVYELLCKVAELVVSSRVSLVQPQRREVNSKVRPLQVLEVPHLGSNGDRQPMLGLQ